jgi:Zn-dependent protease
MVALAVVLAIVLGITIHEFAHAFAGYIQGDMTAKNEGRLTLNPLSHLDPMGSIMLLLAGFGWGRPTPYNPHNLKYMKWGPVIVALFGPLSNLIVVIISFALFTVFAPQFGVTTVNDLAGLLGGSGNLFMIFLMYLYLINIMLMVFNLLPIPPLDGSQILFTVLPERYNNIKYALAKNGPFILLGVILLSTFGNVSIFRGIFVYSISILSRVLF